jgi:hypothetical protein
MLVVLPALFPALRDSIQSGSVSDAHKPSGGPAGDALGNVPVLAVGVASFLLAYLGFATGNAPLVAGAFV